MASRLLRSYGWVALVAIGLVVVGLTVSPAVMTRRVLGGYGPLVAFAALVALMASLAPSRTPTAPQTRVSAGSAPEQPTSGVASGAGGVATATSEPTSGPGIPPTVAGRTLPCPVPRGACAGRDDQVPGDPYSPPCTAWNGGDNGGATARGVTPNDDQGRLPGAE